MVSGATIYAGGYFTSIGGQARNAIAALDAVTGTATAWNPNASSYVNALAVSGSAVYAGGDFTSIGGQARNRIAALDAVTGTATAWNPNASDPGSGVNALAVSGSTVYAGGRFSSIGGQVRNNIAALDAATGTATPWNPNANSYVKALAVSGATLYAGGQFTAIGELPQSDVAAITTATTGVPDLPGGPPLTLRPEIGSNPVHAATGEIDRPAGLKCNHVPDCWPAAQSPVLARASSACIRGGHESNRDSAEGDAISRLDSPSAAANTIRQRSANA